MLPGPLTSIGLLTWLLVAASFARAQPDADASGTFQTAREAYDRGAHDEALGLFRQAYASSGSPVALLYVARSLRGLERRREAAEEFVRTVDVAAASARERDERVRQTALAELADLARDLATVRFVLAAEGTVRIDERVVARLTRHYEEPGTHTVELVGAPCAPWTTTVMLEAGRELVVEVPCHREHVAPSVPPTAPEVRVDPSPRRVPAALTLALGGALTVAGTTLQLVAGSIHADLRAVCRTECPDDARARVDHGQRLERTSIGIFVAAGTSLALGVLLWWLGSERAPGDLALRF